jgi:hypothetical protein
MAARLTGAVNRGTLSTCGGSAEPWRGFMHHRCLRIARGLFVLWLILILAVLTVIDADGDPTTSNLPLLVIAQANPDEAETRAIVRKSRSLVTNRPTFFHRLRRRFRGAAEAVGRFYQSLELPIRGP